MHAGGTHHAELILLFLLLMVGGLTTLSRRFETPDRAGCGRAAVRLHPQSAADLAESEYCFPGPAASDQWAQMYDLNNRVRAAERAALVKMRYEDRISDHVLRKLERELDLLDTPFMPRG